LRGECRTGRVRASTCQEILENGALYCDEENFWADPEAFYSREDRPDCLEATIEARISRLPEEIRKVLDAASVAGIEFTIETLAGALKMDRVELIQLFIRESSGHRIVVPLSLYQSSSRRLSWFRFRHSLFQKYLYKAS
jgi:predicted ATPase